ncbi:MAG: hypothetical protein M0026_09110 [Nocardiopsaceae bacterium]|mgnify:CR=1 FL=1|nr:hypothetical protein [Nocardiopsaceae bacterium]
MVRLSPAWILGSTVAAVFSLLFGVVVVAVAVVLVATEVPDGDRLHAPGQP